MALSCMCPAWATRTIGFTGHVNDNETGLIYMQHRYYDAVAGRFLSIDPVVTDSSSGRSFNRYAYVLNNPYRFVDPDGRDARDSQIAEQKKRERERSCGGGAYCSTGSPVHNEASSGAANRANTLATEISERGFISGKGEADWLYQINSDPNLAVTVDASKLTVAALGEWSADPRGGWIAPGYVKGVSYWVHGQITIRIRPDGTVGIYNQQYHYRMHADFSPRGVARNIATFIGEPSGSWSNTPFTIRYVGNTNLAK
ncbi:RHS repeat-associated core domain-containing protein [Massilia sp. AB1]|nr:RHS repeat-associated core domain-containing protein [Massilia sp. AB1]MBQ5963319.1 RHS repeat-associated core domain-containing protein [Massilia sp. ZL223]